MNAINESENSLCYLLTNDFPVFSVVYCCFAILLIEESNFTSETFAIF